MPTAATASKLTFKVPITSTLHLRIQTQEAIPIGAVNHDTMAIPVKFQPAPQKNWPVASQLLHQRGQKMSKLTISPHSSTWSSTGKDRRPEPIETFQGE
jgi:hypothetical protein